MSAVEETAYIWDFTTDRIDWESNAANVLGVRDLHVDLDRRAVPDADRIRSTAHLRNHGDRQRTHRRPHGVPYRVQYRFMPQGRRSDLDLARGSRPLVAGRRRHGRSAARGVIRVINDRYWEEQRLLFRSDHDELTGQLNRIRLTEALDAAMRARGARPASRAAFLMAAVNNLAVDQRDVRLRRRRRGDRGGRRACIKSKLRGGDTLGRYSSNKFGIILNDCGPGAMRIAAERFMKAVRETPIRTSACQLSATISIGGVLLPDQAAHRAAGRSATRCRRSTGQARSGYDCFMAYEPSPTRESARRAQHHDRRRRDHRARREPHAAGAAADRIDQDAASPTLYECLLRMERPDGSLVSAGEFIAVAEQLGLSRLIDRRTLELADRVLPSCIPNVQAVAQRLEPDLLAITNGWWRCTG